MNSNYELTEGVTRWDIQKFATYNEAFACSAKSSRKYFVPVILGDHNDPRPFWVAYTNRQASQLVKAGYQIA